MPKPPRLPKAELPSDIDPLALLALHALPSPTEEQRDALSAGEHPVDVYINLHIVGTLTVGASSMTTQINKLKPWTLARLLADHVSDDVLGSCINAAICAAKDPHHGTEVMEAEADELKVRAEAAFEQAGLAVRQPKRGSVRLFGTVAASVYEP